MHKHLSSLYRCIVVYSVVSSIIKIVSWWGWRMALHLTWFSRSKHDWTSIIHLECKRKEIYIIPWWWLAMNAYRRAASWSCRPWMSWRCMMNDELLTCRCIRLFISRAHKLTAPNTHCYVHQSMIHILPLGRRSQLWYCEEARRGRSKGLGLCYLWFVVLHC